MKKPSLRTALAVGIPVALVLALGLWAGGRILWYRGWSRGTRTGYVRKLSVKGPPYCKYYSGEMVMQGAGPGQPQEVWEFSTDDSDEASPLAAELHAAEKSGKRVTVAYRQDLHSLYRCTPSEYFVTAVEP